MVFPSNYRLCTLYIIFHQRLRNTGIMAKQVSVNLRASISDEGDLQLTKRKTKKLIKTPGQKPYYYYNVQIKQSVWRRIKEKSKTIESIGGQMTDTLIGSPQIVSLTEDWVIYISIFNEQLYYGIHLYDQEKKQVIPGHGINLSGGEFTNLCEYLEENIKIGPQQLELPLLHFTWEWYNDLGQISDTYYRWTSELKCLESALNNNPGSGWKLHVKTSVTRQEFNSDFLDNILLQLTHQKILSMSNSSPYCFNSRTITNITDGEIDLHGDEALKSISQLDLFKATLSLIKKNRYLSIEDSATIMETVAEYQKNQQILSKLKSDNHLIEMFSE